MAVNCGWFPEGLLASELFGYVRGATGAVSEQQGLFRADLNGRLAQWIIRSPPLREHREDIPALSRALLTRLGGGGACTGSSGRQGSIRPSSGVRKMASSADHLDSYGVTPPGGSAKSTLNA